MPIRNIDEYKEKTPYDICIIGSGPAGMTLCAELKDSGKKICVLESGLLEKSQYADSLRETRNEGEIKIKNSSRERIFGGTSTTWAGLSSPMDNIDFEKWPIKIEDIREYYIKASKYGFPNFNDFSISKEDKIRKEAEFILKSDRLEEKIFIALDPPWNFAKKLKYMFDDKNIDLYIDATVTNLNSNNKNIESVEIHDSKKNKYKISAKKFILAVGGIESTRLLLLSNIGNEYEQVGKYITNHPKDNFGILKLNKPVENLDYLFGYLHKGLAKYAGFRINEKIQKELGLLNSYIRFEPIFPWTDSKGVADLITITKKMKIFLDWWKSKQKNIIHLRDWNETGDDRKIQNKKFSNFKWSLAFINIIKDVRKVSLYTFYRLLHSKKIKIKTIRLRNFMDMEPRPDNRITLSKDVDINDKRLPLINLNVSELDKKSLIELHKIFGEEMKKNNIGIFENQLDKDIKWPIISEASHHLGGTIMGNDIKTSVVNTDLRLHNLDNLYICSGSVFPTSGCANPTYTICALAIRLADKIKKLD